MDLRDAGPEHVAGFDAVIHLAALSNDPLGTLAPELTYDINHHASVRLARLAREAGCGASCTPPPAPSTEPPAATSSSARTPRSAR
nr:hypothetical protein GCM10020093_083290 [Planobispora longispora]